MKDFDLDMDGRRRAKGMKNAESQGCCRRQ